jgi:hypothetical protein
MIVLKVFNRDCVQISACEDCENREDKRCESAAY